MSARAAVISVSFKMNEKRVPFVYESLYYDRFYLFFECVNTFEMAILSSNILEFDFLLFEFECFNIVAQISECKQIGSNDVNLVLRCLEALRILICWP